MNIVPKDGGNRFSGSFFSAWTDKALQSDNLTDDIIARGLRYGARHRSHLRLQPGARRADQARQAVVLRLGPHVVGGRPDRRHLRRPLGHAVRPGRRRLPQRRAVSARQGIDDQSIESALLRLTWQITTEAQVLGLLRRDQQVPRPRDERRRRPGHRRRRSGPRRATTRRRPSTPARWSNQLLAEAGYSFNYEEYVITNQAGVNKMPFTPEWYAGASRRDQNVAALTDGLANWGGRYPDRFNMMGALSYITGVAQHQGRRPVQLGPVREHPRGQRRPAAGLRRHAARRSRTR